MYESLKDSDNSFGSNSERETVGDIEESYDRKGNIREIMKNWRKTSMEEIKKSDLIRNNENKVRISLDIKKEGLCKNKDFCSFC